MAWGAGYPVSRAIAKTNDFLAFCNTAYILHAQRPVRTVRTVRASMVSSEDTMVRASTIYDYQCSVCVSRPKAAIVS